MHASPLSANLMVCVVVAAALGLTGRAQTLPALTPVDTSGRVPYVIADGDPGSGFRPDDPQLARWALRAWERTLGGAIRFEPAELPQALVRVHWVPAGAGQYGEMRPLLIDGRPGAAVYIRPDTDALGPDLARQARADPLFRDTVVYLTCVHELGHALGLSHTADFGDVMHSFGYGGDIQGFFDRYRRLLGSRADIAVHSGLSEHDIAAVRARYPPR